MITMNWKVIVYDKADAIIDTWTIENRSEIEANREAAADVQKLGEKVADWTMTEIKKEEG